MDNSNNDVTTEIEDIDVVNFNTTYSPELTSTLFNLTSSIDAITKAFSALPQHPYDYAKAMFFEEGHVFPTIHDVTVPEHVTLNFLVTAFEQNHNLYQSNVLNYIANPDKYDITNAGNQLNLLAELSGENQFVVTPEKYASYISVLETIQSIKLDEITEKNCIELIHKIGYSVLDVFQRKTI